MKSTRERERQKEHFSLSLSLRLFQLNVSLFSYLSPLLNRISVCCHMERLLLNNRYHLSTKKEWKREVQEGEKNYVCLFSLCQFHSQSASLSVSLHFSPPLRVSLHFSLTLSASFTLYLPLCVCLSQFHVSLYSYSLYS